jgi:hypothetical protein
MALAARGAGLEYLAITDHSRYLGVVKGQDARRLRRQMEAIDRLNGELDGITLLKGAEVDILHDGKLALPDDVLAELDVVIGAVHSHFDLSEQKQTTRVLRAMEHRAYHPVAPADPFDRRTPSVALISSVLRGEGATVLERPRSASATRSRRGPLPHGPGAWRSREHRQRCACRRVNENLEYGVVQARRGWPADDVLNRAG